LVGGDGGGGENSLSLSLSLSLSRVAEQTEKGKMRNMSKQTESDMER